MLKYLRHYNTESEYITARNNDYIEPWTSVTDGKGVDYNKKKLQPLTFSILSDGEIGWKIGSGNSSRQIYYSKNEGEWVSITSTSSGNTIPVVSGDVLRFKGSVFPGSSYDNYSQFTSTCTFAASGNPGSLKYGEETYGDEPLADYCYRYLFKGCTGLMSAPELPATTLVENCYGGMFYGCTKLTTAPELPATTLVSGCYGNMFYGCTKLTTAPELQATTLASSCYINMFIGCTSLTTAPELPATTLASECYRNMFTNCRNLTIVSELPATTLTENCYAAMFKGCTSLTTAPELPATTLADYCYYGMFNGCTKLNYIKAMFTTTPSTSYTGNWVNGVAATGTFVKNASAQWDVTGVSGIPTGWTVQTATE